MLQPNQPQTQPSPVTASAPETSSAGIMSPSSSNDDPTAIPETPSEENDVVKQLQAHLDQIPDDQKQFLAEHLTNEFVRAIGIINGPEVAGYLAQFVDPNKVMVPVPRDVAEQHLAQQQAKGQTPAQQQTQGQPVPTAPAAPPNAPQGGLMSPRV